MSDPSVHCWGVFAIQTYAKVRFPTAAVYGPAPVPELRVVTCGGTFDPATGHYLSNVIVFAISVRWSDRISHSAAAPSPRRPGPV